jgi:hypothetical protein
MLILLTVVSTAFVVATALVAVWQVAEARRSREDQTRPFVSIDFETRKGVIFLVIENVGRTLARNARFKFNPELSGSLDDSKRAEPWSIASLKMFRDGIPSLPPRKRLITAMDIAPQRKPGAYPDVYEVTVDYDSADGKRHYTEPITLDLGVYWGLIRVEQKDVDDIHKRLEELVGVVKKWTATGGGLLAVSPADISERFRAFEKAHARRLEDKGEHTN